jgi:hypothetical protein
MNLNVSGSNLSGLAALAIIFTLVQTVLWFVIAWRAMRAHESIASSLDSLNRHMRLRDEQPSSSERSGNA